MHIRALCNVFSENRFVFHKMMLFIGSGIVSFIIPSLFTAVPNKSPASIEKPNMSFVKTVRKRYVCFC